MGLFRRNHHNKQNQQPQTQQKSSTAMITDCFICDNYPPQEYWNRQSPATMGFGADVDCHACDTYPPQDQRVSTVHTNGIAPSAVNNGWRAPSAVANNGLPLGNNTTGPIAAPAVAAPVPVAPPLSAELKALENKQPEPFYTLKKNPQPAVQPRYAFEIPVKGTVEQQKPELVLQTPSFKM